MTAVGTAAIYARISKARRNGEDGVDTLGVERQQTLSREKAVALGLEVVDVYVDNNLSGKAGVVRPEFERLKSDVIAGRVTDVICWKTDRLSRDRIAIQLFYQLMRDHGVTLHTCQEGTVELDTPDGAFMAGIRAEMAQYERAVIAERVKAQKRQKAQAGELLAGRTRLFGYEDRRRSAVHPTEGAVVERIFREYLAGRSIAGITNRLLDEGVQGVGGAPFRAYHVKRILKNANYAGQRVHHGEIVAQGSWPTLVSLRDYERVQALIGSREPATRSSKRKYLLSSILYCTLCNAKLVGGVSSQGPIYRCEAPANGGCGRLSRNAAKLEDQVVKLTVAAIERMPARAVAPPDTTELDRVTADMLLIEDAHKDGTLPTAVFLDQFRALKKRKDALTEVSVRAPSPDTSASKFMNDDIDTQRETIRAFFPAIGVKPAGQGVRFNLDQLVF